LPLSLSAALADRIGDHADDSGIMTVFNTDHTPLTEHGILLTPGSFKGSAIMGSDDANAVSHSEASNLPERFCEKCNWEMTHLSDLPSYLERAAVRIFRCYVCNNVVSEDRS
jgi:hypothetical protein